MSGDYKYDVQLIAEDLAVDTYNLDFYELTDEQQYEIYTRAQNVYFERLADNADYLRKAERENFHE